MCLSTMDTKRFWEMHAEQDPYWAVVTWEKFEGLKSDDSRVEEFFETGEKHIAAVEGVIKSIRSDFSPRTVLDFGCGVGRLLIPFARRGLAVSGVDISEKMLEITRSNLAARGFQPRELVTTVEQLPEGSQYDLVHSFIAIQHVPRKLGIQIFSRLLDRVADNGMAVLHLTYSPASKVSESLFYYARARIKGIILDSKMLSASLQKLRGKRLTPPILMEDYPLNDVFSLLHDKGFKSITLRPSYHGFRGLVIFASRGDHVEMF